MARKRKETSAPIFGKWEFTRSNYLIFLTGIVIIILAYIIMLLGSRDSFQSVTLAPVMLIIGYLVVIPLAIIYRPRKQPEKQK